MNTEYMNDDVRNHLRDASRALEAALRALADQTGDESTPEQDEAAKEIHGLATLVRDLGKGNDPSAAGLILNRKEAAYLCDLIYRISEQSYRRGFYHGGLAYRDNKWQEQPVYRWRVRTSRGKAPPPPGGWGSMGGFRRCEETNAWDDGASKERDSALASFRRLNYLFNETYDRRRHAREDDMEISADDLFPLGIIDRP